MLMLCLFGIIMLVCCLILNLDEYLQEKEEHGGGEAPPTTDSIEQSNSQPDSQPTVVNQITNSDGETSAEGATQVLLISYGNKILHSVHSSFIT